MEWLQGLDTSLFRFFNSTLKNPVFDRVMPWLSGNALFVPLLILAAVFVIWRYRQKGVLLVVMLALIVPLADGLVSNTIKHAVGRPRPFMTVPDVKHPPGIGRSGNYSSMPSSHATNWFCGAMIGWLYFRRSIRIILPLGIAVAFSRVYNGVHYPSDVLAGAILGAGCGFVGVYTLESIWRLAGKKYFPIWYAQFPTLVPADEKAPIAATPLPQFSKAEIDQHWVRAGYLLIAIFVLVRWIYIGSGAIELSEDEAYQWQWSKHLALSYYSKPPMIAYTQFLGTSIWGDNAFGVRFFSPLLAAIMGLLVLRFFAREVNARTGFILLLCVMTTPLLSVGSTLMTVDPLSVFFWTAAMFAGWKAIHPESGVKHWAWVGLWMGFGLLSKYTGLFQLLCWALFFLLWKPARLHLRRPGPWIALLINALFFIPVIIWNAQHDWITATHVAGNAGLGNTWPPPILKIAEYFFTFLLTEFGLWNPFYFVSALWAACFLWRRYRNDARQVYFFCMGAPVFIIYLFWTFHSRVLPNWIAPSVVPLFCLMAVYWDAEYHNRKDWRVVPTLAGGLILGFFVVLVLHDTNLFKKITGRTLPDLLTKITGRTVPDSADPMARITGWRASAEAVGEARKELLKEGKPVFIIGSHYGITSLVAFYLPEAKAGVPDNPLVYYRTSPRIENQYYFWPGYTMRKGENAIYVAEGKNSNIPPPQAAEFESVTELPPVPIKYRGRTFHTLRMYECRNLR